MFGNPTDPQFQLSSADQWSDGENKPDFGRYVESKHLAL
jgi:hypothetical protein